MPHVPQTDCDCDHDHEYTVPDMMLEMTSMTKAAQVSILWTNTQTTGPRQTAYSLVATGKRNVGQYILLVLSIRLNLCSFVILSLLRKPMHLS